MGSNPGTVYWMVVSNLSLSVTKLFFIFKLCLTFPVVALKFALYFEGIHSLKYVRVQFSIKKNFKSLYMSFQFKLLFNLYKLMAGGKKRPGLNKPNLV